MEVRVVGRGSPLKDASGKASPRPQEFVDFINAHEAEYRPALDAAKKELDAAKAQAKTLRAEAKGLSGEAKKAKNKEARELVAKAIEKVEEADGQFTASPERITGDAGRKLLFKAANQKFDNADAGHASVAAANATLWLVRFGYGTSKPGEAWLRDIPANNKVVFNFICTPSAHDSRSIPGEDTMKKKPDEWQRMEHWFEDYARTNTYKVDITFEKDGKSTPVHSSSYKVKNPPEYASMSADIELDVSKFKGGVLVFSGSAVGSAGPWGYKETRVTRVRVP